MIINLVFDMRHGKTLKQLVLKTTIQRRKVNNNDKLSLIVINGNVEDETIVKAFGLKNTATYH